MINDGSKDPTLDFIITSGKPTRARSPKLMPGRLFDGVSQRLRLLFLVLQMGREAHCQLCAKPCDPYAGQTIQGRDMDRKDAARILEDVSGANVAELQGQMPAMFRGLSCDAGEECVLDSTTMLLGYGSCQNCSSGKYCPANTSNPLNHATLNICPKGYVCDTPLTATLCPAGRYCPQSTSNGGRTCDPDTKNDPYYAAYSFLTWGLATTCPPGSEWHQVCGGGLGGRICENTSVSDPCPQGHWCAPGTNASTVCRDDWFGTGAQRCPLGSSIDPSRTAEWFSFAAIAFIPVVILLEAAGWAEKRNRVRASQASSPLGVQSGPVGGHAEQP